MRRKTRQRSLTSFLQDNWIELIGGVLLLVGIILLAFEGNQFGEMVTSLVNGISQVSSAIRDFLTSHFTLQDLAGLGLGILGLVFIFWRIRVRIDASPRLRLDACPRCGGELRRIRRSALDRLYTALLFPHGRRYQCSNQECSWSGLLHRGQHSQHSEEPAN